MSENTAGKRHGGRLGEASRWYSQWDPQIEVSLVGQEILFLSVFPEHKMVQTQSTHLKLARDFCVNQQNFSERPAWLSRGPNICVCVQGILFPRDITVKTITSSLPGEF